MFTGYDGAVELNDGPVVTVDSVPSYVWGDVVVLSVEDDEAGDGDAGDARVCEYMNDIWRGS